MSIFWILVLNRIYQSPFLLAVYKFYKSCVHFTTMTSELYRICNAAAHQLGWYNEVEFLTNDDSELDEEQEKSPLIKSLSSEEQITAIPPLVIYRIGIVLFLLYFLFFM